MSRWLFTSAGRWGLIAATAYMNGSLWSHDLLPLPELSFRPLSSLKTHPLTLRKPGADMLCGRNTLALLVRHDSPHKSIQA